MPAPKKTNKDPKPKSSSRTAAGEAMKSFNKPSTIKKSDAVVRGMINKSQEKKAMAKTQEDIAKSYNKKGKESAQELSKMVKMKDMGKVLSNQQRLDLANKLKQEAKRDSLAAVSMSKKSAPVKKKK